jgi:hypothetical protein
MRSTIRPARRTCSLNLVDFDEEEIDCAPAHRGRSRRSCPRSASRSSASVLEADGTELPEECLDREDEATEDDEDEERDGEGRPDSPPGLSGSSSRRASVARSPVSTARRVSRAGLPPGLVDGVPPGLRSVT